MITTLMFYMFAAVLIISALMVITSKNPVHSVLWLILAFFNAAGLFLLLGAEFAAFILIIVYVGAVAVLFLFVVMMLDINFKDLHRSNKPTMLIGLLVGAVLIAQLVMTAWNWQSLPEAAAHVASPSTARYEIIRNDGTHEFKASLANENAKGEIFDKSNPKAIKTVISAAPETYKDKPAPSNAHALGAVLYTDFIYPFQLSGLVLLVAMIGAITLTLRHRTDTRRQDLNAQITRARKDVVEVRKVEKGTGI